MVTQNFDFESDFKRGVDYTFKSEFLGLGNIERIGEVFPQAEQAGLYEAMSPDITDLLDAEQEQPSKYLLTEILRGLSIVAPSGGIFGKSSLNSAMSLFLDFSEEDIRMILDFLVRNRVLENYEQVNFFLDPEIADHLSKLFEGTTSSE